MFMITCGKDDATGPAGADGSGTSGSAIYSAWLDVSFKPDTIHKPNGTIDTVGLLFHY